jgi:hypothetical protein
MPALPALPKAVCRLFERGLGHVIELAVFEVIDGLEGLVPLGLH